jgi:hypothetical protein
MKRMILVLAFGCVMGVVNARDLGQWSNEDPTIREWYQALMQPDAPMRHAAAGPMPISPMKCTFATARPMR